MTIRLSLEESEGAATVAEPLSTKAVALIAKRRAQLAGLEGDFGARSVRSGFVTEARPIECPARRHHNDDRALINSNGDAPLSERRAY